jgi:hypothetical protein
MPAVRSTLPAQLDELHLRISALGSDMTADKLVEILKSKGCQPERQRGLHELRDAVHETVHVLQSRSKTYEREALHEALLKAAGDDRMHMSNLLRFELQARAVEMLACQKFGIEYDLDHWAFTMWLETSKSFRVDIGDIETVKDSILIVSRGFETKLLFDRVLRMRGKRSRSIEASP